MKRLLAAFAFLFAFTTLAAATCTAPGHTVGTYGATGAAGWTTYCASDGSGASGLSTQRVYVSNSGSDATGTVNDITKPYQTLDKAVQQLRKGFPDWLLLKKGDSWIGDLAGSTPGNILFGNISTYWSGPNANELAIVGTYDPATPGTAPYYEALVDPIGSALGRPLLTALNSSTTQGAIVIINNTDIDNVAIVGLDSYSPVADSTNGTYYDPTVMASITATLSLTPPHLNVSSVQTGQIAAGQNITTPGGGGLQSDLTGYIDNGSGSAGNQLTVSTIPYGSVSVGMTIVTGCDTSFPASCTPVVPATVTAQLTGTTGGVGTYSVSVSQLVKPSGNPEALGTSSSFTVGTQVSGTTGGAGVYNISLGQTTPSGQMILVGAGRQTSFLSITNAIHTVLVENVKTRFQGSVIEYGGANANPVIRRSLFLDNYAIGVYLQEHNTVLVEENVLDHNGWQPNGWRSTFTHNIYGQYDERGLLPNEQWTYRGNISTRGSDTCLRSRQGGDFIDNYAAQCGYAFDYGGSTSVTSNTVVNNVVQQGLVINNDLRNGNGFGVQGIISGTDGSGNNRTTTMSGNIITHVLNTSDYNFGDTLAIGFCCSSKLNNATNNIIGDWTVFPTHLISDSTGNNTIGTNVTTTSRDLVAYAAANGLTWSAPNRTAETYDLSLGGPGTLDNFMSQARLQSKTNWRTAYTAPQLNNYVRAGFLPAASSGVGLIRYGR